MPLLDPALLPDITGLTRSKMANSQGGDIADIVFQEQPDTLLVHDIAVFDTMCSKANCRFHCLRIGSMGHHLIAALATDSKGGLQLVIQEKRVPVAIPGRPHNTPGEIELDVVHTIFDLLTNGLYEAIGTIALAGMACGEEVTTGGGQKMTAGKDAGTDILPRIKGVFPGHVHEVGRASTTYADHTALGQGFHEAVAKLHSLLDGGRIDGV